MTFPNSAQDESVESETPLSIARSVPNLRTSHSPVWKSADWLPLRTRKKNRIRSNILFVAKELFAERGYQAVTVAEIADKADVSVKTLFTYFRSKEDLAFQDELLLCEDLLSAISERRKGQSLFETVSQFYFRLIQSMHPETLLESLPGFHPWMEDVHLEQRFYALWAHYEERIAELLDKEDASERSPVHQVVAGQIISVMKVLGSKGFKEYLAPVPLALRPRALEKWLQGSLQLLGRGIQGYLEKN